MTVQTSTTLLTRPASAGSARGHSSAAPARYRSLARYADASGRRREVLACDGAGGSLLVIDCDANTRAEPRLVAHLAPDEPAENAKLVCSLYLRDSSRGRCRRVKRADLDAEAAAVVEQRAVEGDAGPQPASQPVVSGDATGLGYRLDLIQTGRAIPELRWTADGPAPVCHRVLTVRDVIGRLESYEPARALTRAALQRHGQDPRVSVRALRGELQRIDASRIVLNRGLREAVLARISSGELSASEIAIRCNRMRRDARGHLTGETSWLARRVGLSAEAGGTAPTPWIHSDVLALVARCGLGVSPHEVELG
jgi:hypothetical protein